MGQGAAKKSATFTSPEMIFSRRAAMPSFSSCGTGRVELVEGANVHAAVRERAHEHGCGVSPATARSTAAETDTSIFLRTLVSRMSQYWGADTHQSTSTPMP